MKILNVYCEVAISRGSSSDWLFDITLSFNSISLAATLWFDKAFTTIGWLLNTTGWPETCTSLASCLVRRKRVWLLIDSDWSSRFVCRSTPDWFDAPEYIRDFPGEEIRCWELTRAWTVFGWVETEALFATWVELEVVEEITCCELTWIKNMTSIYKDSCLSLTTLKA